MWPDRPRVKDHVASYAGAEDVRRATWAKHNATLTGHSPAPGSPGGGVA